MEEKLPMKENKMGIVPVNPLLLSMSIPMMLSMLIQALYNVVDSMFVSQLSQDALNAVSLAFPVQNLMIAVAVGTGVGINAQLSKALGEKKQGVANKTAMNGLFLEIVSSLVFLVLGIAFSHFYYTIQTDIQRIVVYGQQYMFTICVFSIGIFLQITMERTLQSTGRAVLCMYTQASGALINLILDPILIFGLFGFPRLEVLGAAVATVTGQILGAVLGVYLNWKKNPELQFRFHGFRPDREIIKGIYKVGVPTAIMNSIGSVMVFGVNQILLSFTTVATAVFGIYFKLQSFIFMPVFGLNNGMVPILAYNYGARKPRRIIRTIQLSQLYAFAIMIFGFLLFTALPDVLIGVFMAEEENAEELLILGVPALRIMALSFPLAGFSVVSCAVFQALGHGFLSMIASLVRQLCVLVPAAYVLAHSFGIQAVWWAIPIAELFSLALCAIYMVRVYRREIRDLAEPGLPLD